MGAQREQQFLVNVTVDGINLGLFEYLSGGEVDSTETTYQMGAMGPRRAFGGVPQTANLTARGLYDDARRGVIKQLYARAGKRYATVTKQPLDVEGNVVGDPTVWTGILKKAMEPPYDATSTNMGVLELEITVDGLPA